MITAYERNGDEIKFVTMDDDDLGTAAFIYKNGKQIAGNMIRETELKFHQKKRAELRCIGIEIDMEQSSVLEDKQGCLSHQASDL
ncbi:MAG: hypothetical protein WCR42_12265 [bacterium]